MTKKQYRISAIDVEKCIAGGKEYTQEEKFINELHARQLFAENAIRSIEEVKSFFFSIMLKI